MTVLQISVPEKKEKAVRLLLKELGVAVKKVDSSNSLFSKLETAVQEINDIKAGKFQAKNFEDLLNEL